MALFLGLFLGHILGDFMFQPGRLVVAKRRHLSAVLLHTAIVTAVTALVLARSLADTWPAVALAGVAHLGIERITILARRSPQSSNLSVFLLDQGLHYLSLTLVVLALALDAQPCLAFWPVSLDTLALASGVALAALGGSILVFEIELLSADTSEDPNPVLGLDAPRVYGIVERAGAVALAATARYPWAGVLVFLPRLIHVLRAPAGRRGRLITGLAASIVLCTAAWAFVAVVTGIA